MLYSSRKRLGCFALRESGGFIVALRSAIWLTDSHGLLQRKVCDNPSPTRSWRALTTAAPIRDGRFYAGTFWGPGDYNGALLMRIDNRPEAESDPVRYSRRERAGV